MQLVPSEANSSNHRNSFVGSDKSKYASRNEQRFRMKVLVIVFLQVIFGGIQIILGILTSGIYGPWAGVWVVLTALQVSANLFSKHYRKWRFFMHLSFYVVGAIGCIVSASVFINYLGKSTGTPNLITKHGRGSAIAFVCASFVSMFLCLASIIQFATNYTALTTSQNEIPSMSYKVKETETARIALAHGECSS